MIYLLWTNCIWACYCLLNPTHSYQSHWLLYDPIRHKAVTFCLDSRYLPVELTLTPQGEYYGIPQYNVTWRPNDLASISMYLLLVSPPAPPCKVSEFVSSNSAIMNLDANTIYGIRISLSICPNKRRLSFLFGENYRSTIILCSTSCN